MNIITEAEEIKDGMVNLTKYIDMKTTNSSQVTDRLLSSKR